MSFPPAMSIESPKALIWAWEAVVKACLAVALMALDWRKVLVVDKFEIWR